MDRRDFLKTTSAAAAGVAAGATAAEAASATAAAQAATRPAAPALHPGIITRLLLATSYRPDPPGFSARRLVHRIETVSAGRIAVEIASAADAHDNADLVFGSPHEHARQHPAFAFFAGLPRGQGLDAAGLPAWLAVGGGQMLWDELGAGFGFKSLLAGHTGPGAGLWSNRALEAASDFASAKIFAAGLAADLLRSLGAEAVDVPPPALKDALADGRIHAAEWLGPLAAVAPDLQPLAERLYAPAPTPSGMALALTVRSAVWNRLPAAEQALLEVCALAEYHAALAEARAHTLLERHAGRSVGRVVFAAELVAALDRAARDVVERIAAADPVTQRIADSYRAFRRELAGDEPPAA